MFRKQRSDIVDALGKIPDENGSLKEVARMRKQSVKTERSADQIEAVQIDFLQPIECRETSIGGNDDGLRYRVFHRPVTRQRMTNGSDDGIGFAGVEGKYRSASDSEEKAQYQNDETFFII